MASLEEVGSYVLDASMVSFLSLHCWLETQCPFMPRALTLFAVNSVEMDVQLGIVIRQL